MFEATIIRAAMRHAEQEYPNESCGVVTAQGYVPAMNIAGDPKTDFAIDEKWFDEQNALAVLHSHPDGNEYPSESDMRGQLSTDIPWGIIPTRKFVRSEEDFTIHASPPFFWGKGVPIPELLQRGFRHGVTDCYELIRDWYKLERAITLPVYPREWGWWENGGDLYNTLFADAGFRRKKDHEDLAIGDVFLAQLNSSKLNHGGVYIGNGQVIHHPGETRRGYAPDRLSLRDPLISYKPFIRFWIRRES